MHLFLAVSLASADTGIPKRILCCVAAGQRLHRLARVIGMPLGNLNVATPNAKGIGAK